MELNRRAFFFRALAGLIALAAAGRAAARRATDTMRAAIATRYPGPVRTLDEKEVRQPGRWAG